MTYLERLDEALNSDLIGHRVSGGVQSVVMPVVDFKVIHDAARAYRDLLANGARVWWCVDKEAGYRESLNCYTPRNAPEMHDGCGWRLLIDPPKEEAM